VSFTSTRKAKSNTHLQQLVRLPHPRREVLERDVDGGNGFAPEELGLVAPQDRERDAEEDVQPVEEEYVPDTEERLEIDQPDEESNKTAFTSTGKQSVKRDRNHEKQIAGRSTPRSARCAWSFGVYSFT
jgi:hypothetical protein